MDETLRERLNLPVIGGEIVAHFERRYILRRGWNDTDGKPVLIERFPYERLLDQYYWRKHHLREWIKIFKESCRSNTIRIFEYRLERNLKSFGFDDRHETINQFLTKANEWSFDEELISELMQTIYEIKENKCPLNQADLEKNEYILESIKGYILEYKKRMRKSDIRLRGICKVFADKSDDILKSIERKSYNYSLSSSEFYSRSREIINEFFKSEPQKLYGGNWYFYVSFAGPDRRYLDGSIHVSSKNFAKLIDDLEIALEKMRSLKKIEFRGSFNKLIRNSNPKLEVFAEDNKIELKFWVQSKNYDYCQIVDITNLEKIISELKKVKEKGENLALTLESLCF